MPLGSWGRFLVLVAGGSIVVAAVLIVACFVGPGCWGFEYLQRVDGCERVEDVLPLGTPFKVSSFHIKEKKEKEKNIEKIQSKVRNKSNSVGHWLTDQDYVIYEARPRASEARVYKLNETPIYNSKEGVFNLKCAPLLVAPNLYSNVKPLAPKLEAKLFYCGLGVEGIDGRLTVQIISSTILPPREYVATLDPFVTLEIANCKWSLQKSERMVHLVHTGPVKNSLSPMFNETFVFDVKKMEIKNWSLKFTISDDDRLTKVTPLFERRVYLKEVKDLTSVDHIPLNLEMQEVVGNIGALFFGISYLPTAQRLNVTVIKASKLKYQSSVESLAEFCPFVRVIMVNNHGKCVKKKKTHLRPRDDSPVFNQSLVFDLSISNLEQTVFLVLLCTKALCPPTNSDDSSVDGDIEMCLRESRDIVLGTVVLGRNVRCTRARDHWVSVMQNPRKMISVWHDLR